MIHRLVYVSAATQLLDDAALTALLHQCRTRNAGDDITGMLLYRDGSFIQVLEGPAEAVRACYGRIQLDPRHTRVTTVLDDDGPAREFGEWSMGFLNAAEVPPEALDGFSAFLARSTTPADLPPGEVRPGTARDALLAFRDSVR
jgi:hypothetical protein